MDNPNGNFKKNGNQFEKNIINQKRKLNSKLLSNNKEGDVIIYQHKNFDDKVIDAKLIRDKDKKQYIENYRKIDKPWNFNQNIKETHIKNNYTSPLENTGSKKRLSYDYEGKAMVSHRELTKGYSVDLSKVKNTSMEPFDIKTTPSLSFCAKNLEDKITRNHNLGQNTGTNMKCTEMNDFENVFGLVDFEKEKNSCYVNKNRNEKVFDEQKHDVKDLTAESIFQMKNQIVENEQNQYVNDRAKSKLEPSTFDERKYNFVNKHTHEARKSITSSTHNNQSVNKESRSKSRSFYSSNYDQLIATKVRETANQSIYIGAKVYNDKSDIRQKLYKEFEQGLDKNIMLQNNPMVQVMENQTVSSRFYETGESKSNYNPHVSSTKCESIEILQEQYHKNLKKFENNQYRMNLDQIILNNILLKMENETYFSDEKNEKHKINQDNKSLTNFMCCDEKSMDFYTFSQHIEKYHPKEFNQGTNNNTIAKQEKIFTPILNNCIRPIEDVTHSLPNTCAKEIVQKYKRDDVGDNKEKIDSKVCLKTKNDLIYAGKCYEDGKNRNTKALDDLRNNKPFESCKLDFEVRHDKNVRDRRQINQCSKDKSHNCHLEDTRVNLLQGQDIKVSSRPTSNQKFWDNQASSKLPEMKWVRNQQNSTFQRMDTGYLSKCAVLEDERKRFQCKLAGCNRKFTSKAGLMYHAEHGHLIDKNVVKPFVCSVKGCTKRYKNLNGLKYHDEHGH